MNIDTKFKADLIFMSAEFHRVREEAGEENHRPVYFRKEVSIKEDVKKAVLRATSLGIYEFRIDGEKVGEDYLTPGWTEYTKRVYYQTYDITAKLQKGVHTLGAIVADGWYAGNIAGCGLSQYGSIHCLQARIDVEYTDGTRGTVCTDLSWKAAIGGFKQADILMGETFDANCEPWGWDKNGFDDTDWDKVEKDMRILPGHLTQPQKHETVQKMMDLEGVFSHKTKDGLYIYDMGQNMVGTVTVRVKGKQQEKLVLRYGEILEKDGSLYTENLRRAKQTDTYIFHKDAETEYTPRFTYHGFRFVESNLPLLCLTGHVLHSAAKETGNVETSVPMVNRLFQNILWGQRGEWVDIPMDCPQRDERLGWTGDAQVMSKTGCYNMRLESMFRKYLTDIRDAQLPDGQIVNIAPNLFLNRRGEFMSRNFMYTQCSYPGWGDAIFILPYRLYHMYGSKAAILENYDAMRRYAEYLEENGLVVEWHGDWLSVQQTDSELTADAYFAYDFTILSEMADIIGRKEDAAHYALVAEEARKSFALKYVDKDGVVKGETQCGYVLTLAFGLTDNPEAVAKQFIKAVERDNVHLTTGFLGTGYLLPMLCDYGRSDLAYSILLNDTYPSWGYMIKCGATTIWEHWSSYTEEGLQNSSMNSFNHSALGSVGEWMYEYMGGIKSIGAGFEKIQIRPYIDARVNDVCVSYESIKGLIRVEYNVREEKMNVTVPEGTEAVVYLPNGVITEVSAGQYSFFDICTKKKRETV